MRLMFWLFCNQQVNITVDMEIKAMDIIRDTIKVDTADTIKEDTVGTMKVDMVDIITVDLVVEHIKKDN